MSSIDHPGGASRTSSGLPVLLGAVLALLVLAIVFAVLGSVIAAVVVAVVALVIGAIFVPASRRRSG
jgi:uncharacterized metal-binding protein